MLLLLLLKLLLLGSMPPLCLSLLRVTREVEVTLSTTTTTAARVLWPSCLLPGSNTWRLCWRGTRGRRSSASVGTHSHRRRPFLMTKHQVCMRVVLVTEYVFELRIRRGLESLNTLQPGVLCKVVDQHASQIEYAPAQLTSIKVGPVNQIKFPDKTGAHDESSAANFISGFAGVKGLAWRVRKLRKSGSQWLSMSLFRSV